MVREGIAFWGGLASAMAGSSAVVMAMNKSREGEGGVAAWSLVRQRCLLWRGVAGCGRLAYVYLLEKLSMYVEEQQMLVIS
jgi:hypothetical protein